MDDPNQCQHFIQPTIHTFPNRQSQFVHTKMDGSNSYPDENKLKMCGMQGTSKPHLIVVPHGDQTGQQHELIQEVFRYPPGSIQTVVERSHDDPFDTNQKVTTDRPKRKPRNRKKKKFHESQSSIASSSSAVSSKSLSSLPSQTDSVLSCDSITNLNESNYLRPSRLPPRSFRHKFPERCESDMMSDTSSNMSTMSDLSGYEDEYTTIKRLMKDGATYDAYGKKKILSLNESMRKKSYIETKIQDQENTIKSLHSNKEDMEIQIHRLSIQLQNAVREKEVCQEQLDMMHTKLTEKNQQEYFELLKEKVSLEGQYDTLKQEFQHCSTNNSQLVTKIRQSTIEAENLKNENSKLLNNEKELKDFISNLEKKNLKLENELKATNEILTMERNSFFNLKTELAEKEIELKDTNSRMSSYTHDYENYQETIHNLKKWNLEYSEREEQQRLEKRKVENLLSESIGKVNALKENNEWFQAQLNKAQKLQSELQNELSEIKSNFSVVSADRDRCKREVERLNSEIEDNRAKAVRDKSLLLVQLEELEADMREREAVIRRMEEGDKIAHVKLSEDRFKRLEEDHKRLQEIKIEFRDILRHNDSLKEELKHKSLLLRKHEDTIHDLRKGFAVTEKEVGAKQVRIDSLSDKFQETKLKLDKALKRVNESEAMVTQMRDQKLKAESLMVTADEDKKQVDETITRLKEDMSKLSCNFFRMKHDLSAKDKQIETLSNHNSKLSLSEKELLSKNSTLSAQLKENQDGKIHVNEINCLKESLTQSQLTNSKANEEISRFKKSFDSFDVEKKSLLNSLSLRDEQIENMRRVVETYKEKILQKDEEIFTKKDHASKMEKSHSDLLKRFNLLNNEFQMNLQEREELQELEINYKNSIIELKESIKFEKKNKENFEKRYKESMIQLTNTKMLLKEKMEGEENIDSLKSELKEERERGKLNQQEMDRVNAQIEIRNNNIVVLEDEVKCLNLKIEENVKSFTASEKSCKDTIKGKDDEISILQQSLSSKHAEIKSLQSIVSEKEGNGQGSDTANNKFLNSVRHHANAERTTTKQNSKRTPKINTKLNKDEKREVEHLKQIYKDSLNQIQKKNEEIETLMASNNKLKTLEISLNNQMQEIRTENEALIKEKESLNNWCITLQQDLQTTNSNFDSKEEECSEWKLKYENLVDTIPQRDTNTHLTINVDQRQALLRSYEDSVGALFQTKEKPNVADLEESPLQDVNLEEKVKFTQTMAYLQKQISLTAEALQSKDRQISQLNKTLDNQSESLSCVNQQNSIPNDQKKLFSINEKVVTNNQPLHCEASTCTNDLEMSAYDLFQEKCAQLEETKKLMASKETEFKEKQRRYESNLRLLTRKLKEHMKGRRVSEKELELIVKESKTNLEVEQKRYQTLKNRYIDLENKSQRLESEIGSCESLKREREAALHNTEKELEKERKTVLQMQKEIGQTEELKHCLDILREKMNTLSVEVTNKNKALDEVNHSVQETLKEKKVLEDKHQSLMAQMEEMAHRLANENAKVTERERALAVHQEDINKKNEDISNLKEEFSAIQLKCSHLEESIQRIQNEDANNCKQICLLKEDIEALKSCVDLKNSLIEDLKAKKIILDKEILIKDESIQALKVECEQLNKRIQECEEKHESSLVTFNKKIVEAKAIESSLNERLNSVHKEKIAYQSQCTQLKIALNSAFGKLHTSSSMLNLPSPSPLNTESLTKLMEQCSTPASNKFANSLSDRLNSLREEVAVLQTEIKARDQTH